MAGEAGVVAQPRLDAAAPFACASPIWWPHVAEQADKRTSFSVVGVDLDSVAEPCFFFSCEC